MLPRLIGEISSLLSIINPLVLDQRPLSQYLTVCILTSLPQCIIVHVHASLIVSSSHLLQTNLEDRPNLQCHYFIAWLQ